MYIITTDQSYTGDILITNAPTRLYRIITLIAA